MPTVLKIQLDAAEFSVIRSYECDCHNISSDLFVYIIADTVNQGKFFKAKKAPEDRGGKI